MDHEKDLSDGQVLEISRVESLTSSPSACTDEFEFLPDFSARSTLMMSPVTFEWSGNQQEYQYGRSPIVQGVLF